MNLKDIIRTVPDFPIKGIQFRDITSLLEHPEAFNKALKDLTDSCMQFKATKLVAIESRGFIFGSPIARDVELPLILARKQANYLIQLIKEVINWNMEKQPYIYNEIQI